MQDRAGGQAAVEALALADYRRRVAAMYARVRRAQEGEHVRAWHRFREVRDELFRDHPQSALTEAQKEDFQGLNYFDYDERLRQLVTVEADPAQQRLQVSLEKDGLTELHRVGWVEFRVGDRVARLALYWLAGYGGGLFLPFRDGSNEHSTYAGGRYLLDTIKGADLGGDGDRLLLDFNYAYNPSCAYNPRWHCPLAPIENWLEVEIRAGEKSFASAGDDEPDESAVPQPNPD